MSLILRLLGGFVARFWQPIAAFMSAWVMRGQREKIKDLKAEQKTRERIDEADVAHTADDARRMLTERADKRNLRRDAE